MAQVKLIDDMDKDLWKVVRSSVKTLSGKEIPSVSKELLSWDTSGEKVSARVSIPVSVLKSMGEVSYILDKKTGGMRVSVKIGKLQRTFSLKESKGGFTTSFLNSLSEKIRGWVEAKRNSRDIDPYISQMARISSRVIESIKDSLVYDDVQNLVSRLSIEAKKLGLKIQENSLKIYNSSEWQARFSVEGWSEDFVLRIFNEDENIVFDLLVGNKTEEYERLFYFSGEELTERVKNKVIKSIVLELKEFYPEEE